MEISYPDKFSLIISETMHWETGGDKSGAYTNDPDDAGGETKWGISKKANPDVNIKSLTYKEATQLYYARYWNPFYNIFPSIQLTYKVFDMGVLNGPKVAVKYLQKSIVSIGGKTIAVDGVMGPITASALGITYAENKGDKLEKDYVQRFRNRMYRIIFLKPWNIKYKNGWLARINHEPRLDGVKRDATT